MQTAISCFLSREHPRWEEELALFCPHHRCMCMCTFTYTHFLSHHLFNSAFYLVGLIFNIPITTTMYTFFTDHPSFTTHTFPFLHFDLPEVNTCLLPSLFSMCPSLFVIRFSQIDLLKTSKHIKKSISSISVAT